MRKKCIVCNKAFSADTNSFTCSPTCRETRRKEINALKAKRFREMHKHEAEYKAKKISYEKYITITCVECKRPIKVRPLDLKQEIDTYTCGNCFGTSEKKMTCMAKKPKMKNNTTGYIGVYIMMKSWNYSEVWGVQVLISHQGTKVLRNKYKDELATEKTLIQGAVDRDLFIIENDLPHTRNFSDDELSGHLGRLGYYQLQEFKDKVSSGKIILTTKQEGL